MVEGGELSRQFHHRPRPHVSKSCVKLQFATDVGSGCSVGGLIVNKGHGTWVVVLVDRCQPPSA